jgi:hypothetical protein
VSNSIPQALFAAGMGGDATRFLVSVALDENA